VSELESGKHPRDNKLLQRIEKKLGVWLTGSTDRIGEPKTEEPKKAPKAAETAMTKSGGKPKAAKEGKNADGVQTSEAKANTDGLAQKVVASAADKEDKAV
jgi:hypothetical protein